MFASLSEGHLVDILSDFGLLVLWGIREGGHEKRARFPRPVAAITRRRVRLCRRELLLFFGFSLHILPLFCKDGIKKLGAGRPSALRFRNSPSPAPRWG